MYIAFKWLSGLALAMWISMCIIDVYTKHSKEVLRKGYNTFDLKYRNTSIALPIVQNIEIEANKISKPFDSVVLHYVMFFAGAVAVSVFNKKGEIISYAINSMAKMKVKKNICEIKNNVNKAGTLFVIAIRKECTFIWEILLRYISKIQNYECRYSNNAKKNNEMSNSLLMEKIREFAEEIKKLGQQLEVAVCENKNLKLQHQIEIMAKNRLVKYKEDIQKKVKENQSKYISVQHLYIETNQENLFLKSRVRHLTKEKENVEKDLMAIVSQIYKSKNIDLITYCSKFLVRPRRNFVNANINEEVQKFLEKSYMAVNLTTDQSKTDKNIKVWSASVMKHRGAYSDRTISPIITDAPRLKGLPGECIWTIKDRNGIIEKLYEYDFDSDFENGDIIHRIREYSVYHDKDCLLDFTSSRRKDYNSIKLQRVLPSNQKFLTGSEAFQRFLQNSRNVISTSRSPTTRSLLCI